MAETIQDVVGKAISAALEGAGLGACCGSESEKPSAKIVVCVCTCPGEHGEAKDGDPEDPTVTEDS